MSRWESIFSVPDLTRFHATSIWQSGSHISHIAANTVTALSYFLIVISMIPLSPRLRVNADRWIGYGFMGFVLTMAMTHGLALILLRVPATGGEALAEAATAVATVTTAAALWITAPWLAVALSSDHLRGAGADVTRMMVRQKRRIQGLVDTNLALRRVNDTLEDALTSRADEVRSSNEQLQEVAAEQVVTRAALTDSKAEYEASFEAATVGKAQLEPWTGRQMRVNAAFASMLGYEARALAGRVIWDLAYPDDRAAAHAGFDRLLAREIGHWVMEMRFVRRDGVPVWGRISATLVIDPAAGLPRLALMEIEDLDMRHEIQSGLRATEARLRRALEIADIGIWEFDIPHERCWTDHRSSLVTGGQMPPGTWISMNGPLYADWIRRIHPDDREPRDAKLRTLFAGDADTVRIGYRAQGPDGAWLNLLDRCAVVERDRMTGLPARAAGVVSDVTEQVALLTAARMTTADQTRRLEAELAAHARAAAPTM